jgi:hypothetical protein
MSDSQASRPLRWKAIVRVGVLVGISLGLVVVAYRAMFSSFQIQDDEGYALLSLRMFNAGGALYDQVYSQYGPGFFVFVGGLLRLLHVPLTSDGARMVNLVLWTSSSLLAGLVLLRLTRHLLVAAIGLLVAFLVLHVDANEPLHPGASIGFLLVLLVAVTVFLAPSRRSLAMALVGACAAALLSIKANVGGLAFISIAVACVFTVPSLRRRRVIPALVATLFVLTPILLLSGHLPSPAIWHFAALASLSALALVCILGRIPRADGFEMWDVYMVAVGAVVVLSIAITVVLAQGTTLTGLIDGAVVNPASTPTIQFAPPVIGLKSVAWALAGLLTAVGWRRWVQGKSFGSSATLALGITRLGAGLLIWIGLTGEVMEEPMIVASGLMIGAPIAWLSAVPDDPSPEIRFVRALIPALAILQVLHGYPVPGSQLAWGQLLLVVVGGICVGDGLRQVSAAAGSLTPRLRAWPVGATLVVLFFGVWLALKPLHRYSDEVALAYSSGVPLDLPGARRLRLEPAQAEQLRALSGALRRDCRTFLTMPGLDSLYLFTGEPAPVELSGPWMYFLSAADQRRIVQRVAPMRGLCVVRSAAAGYVWFLLSGHHPTRPLVQFIDHGFMSAATFEGNGPVSYELMVRKHPRR